MPTWQRRSRIARMFLATTLLYPCVLAALCARRRAAGRSLQRLLPACAAAVERRCCGADRALPAEHLLFDARARDAVSDGRRSRLAGFALGVAAGDGASRGSCRESTPGCRACRCSSTLLALAPVLLAGRPSFSSYMALADSAVHMMGADFLIRHGQRLRATWTCATPTASSSTTTTTRATRPARTRCSAAAPSCSGCR